MDSEYNVQEAANEARQELLPQKSKIRYENAYKCFKNWCQERKQVNIDENVLLAYFMEKSKENKAPSSLWCEFSMIKSMLSIMENHDTSKYFKLRAFFKRKNEGYQPKKSNVFTREEINRFLVEASDQYYLMMKVVTILGLAGACRSDELVNMSLDDIKDNRDVIIVKIPKTKNKVPRTFTVIDNDEHCISFLGLFRKYLTIRNKCGTDLKRFFLRYEKGRCVKQPVGKNTFSRIPSTMAKFLNLPNPEAYTGHSFRRTSATLLADAGVDVLGLKRLGGWKSATVAEGYVAESMKNKIETTNKIFYNNNQPTTSTAVSTDQISIPSTSEEVTDEEANHQSDQMDTAMVKFKKCSKCTFTIHIHNN